MNENNVDLEQVVYPYSVMVSEPVEAKKDYDEVFKDSKFIIYISIYSSELNKDYTVNSVIIDLLGKVETSNKTFKTDDLNSQDYKDHINAINLIFNEYNKHLLNFPHNELYKLVDFYSLINDWIETEVKPANDKLQFN